MSLERQTAYENLLDQAVAAGDAGERRRFDSTEKRNHAQRQLLTARNNRRREMKKVYEPTEALWGTSPWDHLQIVRDGAFGLWIVPIDTFLKDMVTVVPAQIVGDK